MSVKKNFSYNVIYQILNLILPLLTAPYLSRVIGANGVGIYSYTYSIVNYFMLFSLLGLNNYGNRSIAMIKDDRRVLSRTFFEIYGMQLLSSLIMIALYLTYLNTFDVANKDISYIQILFILSTMLDINWFFFGLEKFKLTVSRNTLIKFLTVIGIFTFVKEPEDLKKYVLIMSLGTVISQLSLWYFVPKYIDWYKPSWKDILKHLKPNLILFIPVVSVSIYKVMDKIMLGNMTDMKQVAYYENSEKLIGIPMGFILALGTVMLPRMSYLMKRGEREVIKNYIEISLQFIMFLSGGICFGLSGISANLIPIFFGNEFLPAIPVLSLLSFSVLFTSWANVIRTQYLIPNQKDKIYILSTSLGAVINVIFNLILIPKYGGIGAAIGTVFAELAVALYQTISIKNELPVKKFFNNIKIYLFPALIMYSINILLTNLIDNKYLSLFLQLCIGGGVYVILCVKVLISNNDKVKRLFFNKFKDKLDFLVEK